MSKANCERPRPAPRGRPRRQPPVPVRSTRSCPARADDQPWDSLPNIPQDMNVAAAAGFQAGAALPADGRGPARESPVPRVSNTLRLIRNTPGLRPPPFPLAVSRPRSSSCRDDQLAYARDIRRLLRRGIAGKRLLITAKPEQKTGLPHMSTRCAHPVRHGEDLRRGTPAGQRHVPTWPPRFAREISATDVRQQLVTTPHR